MSRPITPREALHNLAEHAEYTAWRISKRADDRSALDLLYLAQDLESQAATVREAAQELARIEGAPPAAPEVSGRRGCEHPIGGALSNLDRPCPECSAIEWEAQRLDPQRYPRR